MTEDQISIASRERSAALLGQKGGRIPAGDIRLFRRQESPVGLVRTESSNLHSLHRCMPAEACRAFDALLSFRLLDHLLPFQLHWHIFWTSYSQIT